MKPRRVRAMAMIIQYGVRGMILAAPNRRRSSRERTAERLKRSPVLWAEIGESSLIGPELVQETTDKVVEHVYLKSVSFGKCNSLGKKFLFDELRDRVVKDIVTQLQEKLLELRYLVKVSWNSKRNFELTWVWEDYLKDKLVKPLVLTYESVVMYGLCVYMLYVDCVRVGNQSSERDRLIGIGLVMDLVKFLSFTFGDKEMTFVVLAFLR
ncbi:hypothetical protein Tco_0673029 [Tanacetum coccineum]